jgi:DNA-binding MarR family transcriptional regulator
VDETGTPDQDTSSPHPVLDLDRYVPGLLTFLANKLSRGASALYRRHFDVGINDWRVMSMLALEPGVAANRICQVIGLDKSVVSRSLAGLEAHGLVAARDDGQPRRRRMALTEAGLKLHDELIAVALERERRLLECLTSAECETLIALLDRLHRRLPAVNEPMALPPRRTRKRQAAS